MALAEILAGQARSRQLRRHSRRRLHPAGSRLRRQDRRGAEAAGIAYKAGKFPFTANGRAGRAGHRRAGQGAGHDATTDRVLGVHIIGTGAGEMIHEAAVLMEFGGSSEDLGRTCHAHPTMSEAVKEAALATFNKPIHL